jgi:hypothetical protein
VALAGAPAGQLPRVHTNPMNLTIVATQTMNVEEPSGTLVRDLLG